MNSDDAEQTLSARGLRCHIRNLPLTYVGAVIEAAKRPWYEPLPSYASVFSSPHQTPVPMHHHGAYGLVLTARGAPGRPQTRRAISSLPSQRTDLPRICCMPDFSWPQASPCRRCGAVPCELLASPCSTACPRKKNCRKERRWLGPHCKVKGVRLQDAFSYPHPRGTPRLREAFAGYLESTFFKACSACLEHFGRGNSMTCLTETRLRRERLSMLST